MKKHPDGCLIEQVCYYQTFAVANIAENKVSMQFTTSSFFSLFFIFLSFSAVAQDWSLAKEGNEVQLLKRTQESGLFEIKAITQVSASPEAFLKLLMDTESGPEWIDNAVSVEVLASPNPETMIVQTAINAPWPLKNRDMITQSITSIDKRTGIMTLTITDKSDYAPELKNSMRMKNIMGTWTLTPNETGTQIMYQGSGEAGGVIPTWLSNKILISSTFKSFVNMREKVVQDQYQ
ncbi:hypothetical protein EYS14_01640 [Alteromonadaceae bacterium M269]|nr:hypothetical protein EYS14_01640 [Alteromonadaceae bacterium M269]